MKTKKALILTSVFQVLYCNGCIGTVLGFALARYYHLSLFFTLAEVGLATLVFNPTGLICFIVCLCIWLKERKDPKAREDIGRRWIWIFLWLAITTVFYAASIATAYAITR